MAVVAGVDEVFGDTVVIGEDIAAFDQMQLRTPQFGDCLAEDLAEGFLVALGGVGFECVLRALAVGEDGDQEDGLVRVPGDDLLDQVAAARLPPPTLECTIPGIYSVPFLAFSWPRQVLS